jgi:hypothetical protein
MRGGARFARPTLLAKQWHALILILTGIILFSGTVGALACDTPVYRYAMYNWPAEPYRVYCFHRGEPDNQTAQTNRLLAELGGPNPPAANLLFQTVDVAQKAQLDQLPQRVREVWESHAKEPLPIHVVLTSWGAELSARRLDPAAVPGLADSPLRKSIAELLAKGHVAVFLLLSGPDRAENERAEKVAREVIAQAAAGKIGLEPEVPEEPPAGAPAGLTKGAGPEAKPAERPKGLQVGLLKLDRAAAAETWLLRSLLTVERDLPEAVGQPLVFAFFGRGRVLPPCIGKGITAENLTDQVAFLKGACSCIVKDQNPGVDMLFRWDWEATADALAAQEQEALGPAGGRRSLSPDSVVQFTPATPPQQDPSGKTPAGPTTAVAGDSAIASSQIALPTPLAHPGPPVGKAASAAPDTSGKDAGPQGPAPNAPPGSAPYATKHLLRFGVGFALVAIVVVAAGLLLMRKNHQ